MLGNQLKQLRKDRKLSGPEMAEFLQLPYASYAKYERNERFPAPDKLIEMANRLNISIDYLLGNSDYRVRIDDYLNKYLEQKRLLQEKLSELEHDETNLKSFIDLQKRKIKELDKQIGNLPTEEFFSDENNQLLQNNIDSYKILADFQQKNVELKQDIKRVQNEINKIDSLIEEIENLSNQNN